ADGRHGHPPGGVMGTEPIEQEVGERWENYVQRSARFCAETMTKEQPAWNTHPGSAHLPLSLCLRVYPTKPVEALTPGARGSGSETDIAGRLLRLAERTKPSRVRKAIDSAGLQGTDQSRPSSFSFWRFLTAPSSTFS